MSGCLLDESDMEAIGRTAELIASNLVDAPYNATPSSEAVRALAAAIAPPMHTFVDGLRHLLTLDKRLLRAIVVVESEDEDAHGPMHIENLEAGDVIVAFGMNVGNNDLHFINFGLNVHEDLSSIPGLYETIRAMDGKLREVLAGGTGGAEAAGGEDSQPPHNTRGSE